MIQDAIDLIAYASRYYTNEEISDIDYMDDINFVQRNQLSLFIQSRYSLKKKDKVDYFLEGQEDFEAESYFSANEARRSRGIATGICLPPYVSNDFWLTLKKPDVDTQAIEAVPNRTMIFKYIPWISNKGNDFHTKVKIQVDTQDASLKVFEIRNSTNNNKNFTIKAWIQFSEDVEFFGMTISSTEIIGSLGTTIIFLKGNKVILFSGADYSRSYAMATELKLPINVEKKQEEISGGRPKKRRSRKK
jgi:hypothetical protein